MTRRIPRWLAVTLLVPVVLASAVIGYLVVQARKMPAGRPEYVAMGSSYAAGPGIPTRTTDRPSFCFQSDQNYAHQLARMQALSLVDMSCGGATSAHILQDGLLFQGPQVRAITADTRLVTITVGGNDIAYIGNLIALGCGPDTSVVLRLLKGCKAADDNAVEAGFVRLSQNMRAIGAAIHDRAPQARILLITYPTILPPKGTCSRLGLPEASADKMRIVAARLEAAMQAAAREMRAELVNAGELSRDHSVCASEPWITPAHPGGYAPLHPNLAGMSALAAELDRILRTRLQDGTTGR